MKNRFFFTCRGLVVLAGLLLAASAGQSRAQTADLILDQFNDASETMWSRWWGAAFGSTEFDATMDANNNANSGSMKVTINYDNTSSDNQWAINKYFPQSPMDATPYATLVFDLHFDPSSPKNSAGNFGSLEYGLIPQDWSQVDLGPLTIPATATNGWYHVAAPIAPSLAGLTTMRGLYMKIWAGSSAGALNGQAIFWVDNVKLLANTNTAVVLPRLTFTKPLPGLQLTASAAGAQYQRQSIVTVASDTNGNANAYSWVGASKPVTYSLTLTQFPDAAHSGFQAQMFLVPQSSLVYGARDSSVDWNAGNVIFVQIANMTNGAAVGRFMYKTNQPGGNSMLWNSQATNGPVGTLALITNATPTGTWSVSFQNETQVTLTTPSGSSTNFTLPSDAAALWADPIFAYFGIQPNQTANIGQFATIGRIQIAGPATTLDDSFAGNVLDPNLWQTAAQDAPGIVQIPAATALWLKWPAPSTGFVPQVSTNLTAGSWGDTGLTNIVQIGAQKTLVIPTASLPAGNRAFYRLAK